MLMRIGALNAPVRRVIKFNPKALFANGEQGFWNDPQDLSAMFQDSAGATPVTAIGQPIGRINSANGSGVYASQATSSKKPILKRMPTSGIRNVIADNRDNTTGNWTRAKITASIDSITESTDFGTHTLTPKNTINDLQIGDVCTASCDVRQSLGSRRALLFLGGAFVGKFINFNFDTKTLNISVGVDGGCIDNGDGSYRIWITGASPGVGNASTGIRLTDNDTAGFREYTGDGVSTIGVTNYQFERGNMTDYQRVVGDYDVSEGGYNQVYSLDYDGVDDELISNNPDLGSNATRIRAQLGGPVIESGLTLGANLTLNADNLGLILINRALTADELAAITAFYTEMVT